VSLSFSSPVHCDDVEARERTDESPGGAHRDDAAKPKKKKKDKGKVKLSFDDDGDEEEEQSFSSSKRSKVADSDSGASPLCLSSLSPSNLFITQLPHRKSPNSARTRPSTPIFFPTGSGKNASVKSGTSCARSGSRCRRT
jgi:hypothetical protein